MADSFLCNIHGYFTIISENVKINFLYTEETGCLHGASVRMPAPDHTLLNRIREFYLKMK